MLRRQYHHRISCLLQQRQPPPKARQAPQATSPPSTTFGTAPPGSQSALAAIGGYCFPFFSTFGSHVQRSASGTWSITDGTWEPQPHQEAFSAARRVSGYGLRHWDGECGLLGGELEEDEAEEDERREMQAARYRKQCRGGRFAGGKGGHGGETYCRSHR